MVSIPSEVWTHIFSFACTDDGHTGRVISLVSRRFCFNVTPVKLQSVAVRGRKQIERFLKLLKEVPTPVQHLFICSDPWPDRPDDDESPFPVVITAILDLLELVAPALRSLHVITPHFRPTLFFPIPFPRLEELIMQGPLDWDSNPRSPGVDFAFSCPKLRRLALAKVSWGDAPDLFKQCNLYAPNLVSIRLQSEGSPGGSLVKEVEKALLVTKGTDNDVRGVSPSLAHLLIHPGCPPRGVCGTFMMSYFKTQTALQELEARDPRITLLPHYQYGSHPWAGSEEGYCDWMTLQGGDESYWHPPPKDCSTLVNLTPPRRKEF